MQNLIRKIVLIISLVLNLNLLISSKEQITQNQIAIEITALPKTNHIDQNEAAEVPPPAPTPPSSPTNPADQVVGNSKTSPSNNIDATHHSTDAPRTVRKEKRSIQPLPKPVPQYKKVPQVEPPSAPSSSPRLQRSNTHTPYIMSRKITNIFGSKRSLGRDRSESYSFQEYMGKKKSSLVTGESPVLIHKKTMPVSGYKFPSRRGSKACPNASGDWFPSTPNISNPIMLSPKIVYKKTIPVIEQDFRSRIGSTSSNVVSNRPSNQASTRTNKTTPQPDDPGMEEDQDEMYGINAPREVRKSSLLNNYTSTLADVGLSDREEILHKFINSLPLLQHLENMIRDAEEAELRLEDIEREEAYLTRQSTQPNSTPQGASTTFRSAQPSMSNLPRTLSRDKTKEIYTKCLNALIEGAVSNPLVYNVLSIDGGGVRGIVACIILDKIERSTGRRVQELFNVFTGTSIGGIIAIALLLQDSQGNFLYRPYELYKILTNNADKIFSRPWYACISRAFRSKYDNKNLKLLITALIKGKKTGHRVKAELNKAGIQTKFEQYYSPRTSISSSGSYTSETGICCPHLVSDRHVEDSETSSENSHTNEVEGDILKKENVITTLLDVSNPPVASESRRKPTESTRSGQTRYETLGDDELMSQFNLDELGSQAEYLSDTDDPRLENKAKTTRSKMRLIVPAYDIHGLNTVIFDSAGNENYSLIDVALSTSAAPTYFPSHPTREVNKEDDTLNNVDGGLFSNFPAPAAISRLIGHNRLKPQLHVVSASTGSTPKASEDNRQKDRGRVLWATHGLFSIIRRSPTQFGEDTLTNCAETYIRFRVPLKHASSSMDKSTKKNIKNLVNDTAIYCRDNEGLFMDVKKKILPLDVLQARNVEPVTYTLPDTLVQHHVVAPSRMNSYSGLRNNSTTTLYSGSTPRAEYYADEEGELEELHEIIGDDSPVAKNMSKDDTEALNYSDETLDETESDYYDDEVYIPHTTKP